jgi:hypothetical protein
VGVPGGVQHAAESGVAMRSIVAAALSDTCLVSFIGRIDYILILVNIFIEQVR